MARDASNIISGPASVTLGGTEVGHTQGGVTFSITPQFRARTVDEFGASELSLIHQGDQARLTVPWAEWSAATLAEIYNGGNDQTAGGSGGAYIGIGRNAGYIYTDQAAEVVPINTANSGKKISLNRVTPIGQIELSFSHENDRVINVEFACLVDEEETDGEGIGKIFVGGS